MISERLLSLVYHFCIFWRPCTVKSCNIFAKIFICHSGLRHYRGDEQGLPARLELWVEDSPLMDSAGVCRQKTWSRPLHTLSVSVSKRTGTASLIWFSEPNLTMLEKPGLGNVLEYGSWFFCWSMVVCQLYHRISTHFGGSMSVDIQGQSSLLGWIWRNLFY